MKASPRDPYIPTINIMKFEGVFNKNPNKTINYN